MKAPTCKLCKKAHWGVCQFSEFQFSEFHQKKLTVPPKKRKQRKKKKGVTNGK
jgi:hypothetical protein